MIAPKTLKLSLKSLRDFAKKRLPDETLIELDERDECPLDIVRYMCDPDRLGLQLLFIPEVVFALLIEKLEKFFLKDLVLICLDHRKSAFKDVTDLVVHHFLGRLFAET